MKSLKNQLLWASGVFIVAFLLFSILPRYEGNVWVAAFGQALISFINVRYWVKYPGDKKENGQNDI